MDSLVFASSYRPCQHVYGIIIQKQNLKEGEREGGGGERERERGSGKWQGKLLCKENRKWGQQLN